ncbi:unnamed protein product [Boreogadus saida]
MGEAMLVPFWTGAEHRRQEFPNSQAEEVAEEEEEEEEEEVGAGGGLWERAPRRKVHVVASASSFLFISAMNI